MLYKSFFWQSLVIEVEELDEGNLYAAKGKREIGILEIPDRVNETNNERVR